MEHLNYFHNFDLENIITPVDVDQYESLLLKSRYNLSETSFLVESFKNGFSLGYCGQEDVKIKSPNLKITGPQDLDIIWNKVMKEVEHKRYAGPFTEPPFHNYIQSLIGLVHKDNGQDHRLIFHLSYPRELGLSMNENTPAEICKVKYPDFKEAILLCSRQGRNCKIARSDMKVAFRNLGILKKHWKFLILKAKNPADGKYYYFVDKCLPFGASISCAHFQRFSNSIAHIVTYFTGQENINYLDDYLFAHLLE